MIKVGQVLPGVYPSVYTDGDIAKERQLRGKLQGRQRQNPWDRCPVTAVVEWIHPESRFCVIRYEYKYPDRSFRECRSLRRVKHGS